MALDEAEVLIRWEDSQECADSVINEVVSKAATTLHDHYLDSKVPDYCAREAVEDVVQLVEWHFLNRDPGDENADLNPSYTCEPEPAPCAIDVWARGAVPIKSRPKVAPLEAEINRLDAGSAQSKRSRAPSHGVTRRIPTKTSWTDTKKEAVDAKKQSKLIPLEQAKSKEDEQKEKEREAQLRKMEKKQKLAMENALKSKEREQEEEKKFEKLKAELRGKEYTLDSDGNAIIINAPNPDKMGKLRLEPQVGVVETPQDEEGGAANTSKSKRVGKTKAAVGKEKDKEKEKQKEKEKGKDKEKKEQEAGKEGESVSARDVKGKEKEKEKVPKARKEGEKKSAKKKKGVVEPDFRKANVAPSVLETMKLSSGVTLRDGSTVKKGPRPEFEQTLTRSQYTEMLDTAQKNTFPLSGSRPIAQAPLSDTAKVLGDTSVSQKPGNTQQEQQPASSSSPSSSSPKATTTTGNDQKLSLDLASPTSTSPAADAKDARARCIDESSNAQIVNNLSPTDLFNASLLQDSQWGVDSQPKTAVSPGKPLPPSPSPEQRKRAISKVPRVRADGKTHELALPEARRASPRAAEMRALALGGGGGKEKEKEKEREKEKEGAARSEENSSGCGVKLPAISAHRSGSGADIRVHDMNLLKELRASAK